MTRYRHFAGIGGVSEHPLILIIPGKTANRQHVQSRCGVNNRPFGLAHIPWVIILPGEAIQLFLWNISSGNHK